MKEKAVRKRTVYILRTRLDDSKPWSLPMYFRKRRDRDSNGASCRCLLGVRTHSYEEKRTPAEIDELCNDTD